MNEIKVVTIEVEELKNQLKGMIKECISDNKPLPAQPEELLTREKAAELLHITLPTLRAWTKKGDLVAYMMGDRVFYKRSEIINALVPTKKVA